MSYSEGVIPRSSLASNSDSSNWQKDLSYATGSILSVAQRDGAAVGLGDLPHQRETDAGAALLCGVERDKKVRRVTQTKTRILHLDRDRIRHFVCPQPDSGSGILLWNSCIALFTSSNNRFDSILNQVNEQLLKLIRIDGNFDFGNIVESDRHARLERDYPFQQRTQRDLPHDRRRKLRQLTIGLHKSIQRFGPSLNNREAAGEIAGAVGQIQTRLASARAGCPQWT